MIYLLFKQILYNHIIIFKYMLFKRENYQIKSNSLGFYQDLEHIDGIEFQLFQQTCIQPEKKR